MLPEEGLVFVPMQADDLPQVLAMEQSLVAFPWTIGHFADSLAAGHLAWLLRTATGELIAYAVLQIVLDEAELLNIGVRADCQGRGVGRQFLEFLCAQARQRGAAQMFLEVRVSNTAARALYAGQGFQQTGERAHYYPAAQGRETALLLTKTL